MKFWAAIAGLVAILGSFWKVVWTATSRAKLKGKADDHDRADEIRDNVRDAAADDRLRKHDGDGWRD